MVVDTRWVPVKTAAKVLGVSGSRVYKLINEGKLIGRKLDGMWLVHMSGVELRAAKLKKEAA